MEQYSLFETAGKTSQLMLKALILIALIILTVLRNDIWHEEISLWTDTIKKSPSKARSYNNRGEVYFRLNKLEQALDDFERALSIKPDYTDALYNIGVIYYYQKREGEAIEIFKKVLSIEPDYYDALYNLGIIYGNRGDLNSAIFYFTEALKVKETAEAYLRRAIAFRKKGNIQQAEIDFKRSYDMDPSLFKEIGF